jgi:hypothetical protein
MLSKFTISIFIFFTVMGTVSAQSPLLPGKLAIYYGWPSLVNGSGGNLNAATEVFNDYDIVVFGDGLQYDSHQDHNNTATIINNLKTPPNNTAVYGYIPIGVTTGNLSMAEIQNRVNAWNAMGIAGIFLDETGYDFGVSRQRQNDIVDYVHNKGLSVFINAWNPDDVFSDAIEPTYNPAGISTHLDSNDIYLYESFQIILSDYQDATSWANKSDKALTYKNRFGTRMATVTTVSPENPSFNQGKLDYAWWSTLLYGFDFMGWGELFFSALDNNLPYRKRPDVGEIGSAFISFAVSHNSPLHTRTTTRGTIEVNTDTHMGRFIGNVYYVAPTGNDSNPGTETQPWQTIQKAANTLTSGDTVYIRAGIYREQVIPQNSGSDSNHYITYTAYPGETVTLDGSSVSVPEYTGLIYVVGRNYIRISGLRVINSAYAGILVDNSGHITLEKNYTDNTASSGIGVWGSNYIIIDGNEIERACSNRMQEFLTMAGTDTFEIKNNRVHNGVAEYRKEGIDVKDGSSNGKVYGNHVYSIQSVGIYIDAWDKHTFNIDVFQNTVHDVSHDVSGMGIALASEQGGLLEHIRVYNNIVYHNRLVGIWLPACCEGVASHPMSDIKIINNTFYNNGWETWGGGIGVENPDIQNVVIRNNIVSQNLYFQIAADASKVTVDHNLIDGFRGTENEIYGEDYVEGNPLFMNPSGADFHLQPNSPAIGRGSSADAPTDDFDGNPRPNPPGSNPDIGAYEHERGPLMLSISGVSPNVGPLAGGTRITITGMGFVVGATVTIGGNSATDVTVVSDTKITAKTPAGTAGIKDVIVTNPDSLSATLKNGFFYATLPRTGDVSGDGTISAYDAALILQFVVGLIDHFPVEDITSPSFIMPQNYMVRAPEQTAKAGDRIHFPIVIDDATGLLAGGISLKYDPTILKALNVASQTLFLNGAYSKANISKQGEVRFAFATTEAMNGQGNLFMVEFEVLPDSEGKTSPLILDSVSLSNSLSVTKINGSVTVLPQKSVLFQNYPNPFNPETWIPFKLAQDASVVISIHNVKGQLIRAIALGNKNAGVYTTKGKAAYWDGKDSLSESVASGVYFYTLQAGEFRATRKMVIIK